MFKTKRYLNFLMFASLIGILASCSYDFIEYPAPPPPPDPEDTISFSLQIEPIFNNNDKCTACHKEGFAKGNFTTGAAYNAIVPSLINLTVPEESIIYWHAHPSSDVHTQKKLSLAEADLILFWIQKGALNN
jgi:hypothetical protein